MFQKKHALPLDKVVKEASSGSFYYTFKTFSFLRHKKHYYVHFMSLSNNFYKQGDEYGRTHPIQA